MGRYTLFMVLAVQRPNVSYNLVYNEIKLSVQGIEIWSGFLYFDTMFCGKQESHYFASCGVAS